MHQGGVHGTRPGACGEKWGGIIPSMHYLGGYRSTWNGAPPGTCGFQNLLLWLPSLPPSGSPVHRGQVHRLQPCKVLTVSLSFLSRSSSRCRLPARSSAESACSCKLRIFLRTASSELLPAIARGAGCSGAPPLRMPPDEARSPSPARSPEPAPRRPPETGSGGPGRRRRMVGGCAGPGAWPGGVRAGPGSAHAPSRPLD